MYVCVYIDTCTHTYIHIIYIYTLFYTPQKDSRVVLVNFVADIISWRGRKLLEPYFFVIFSLYWLRK